MNKPKRQSKIHRTNGSTKADGQKAQSKAQREEEQERQEEARAIEQLRKLAINHYEIHLKSYVSKERLTTTYNSICVVFIWFSVSRSVCVVSGVGEHLHTYILIWSMHSHDILNSKYFSLFSVSFFCSFILFRNPREKNTRTPRESFQWRFIHTQIRSTLSACEHIRACTLTFFDSSL